MEYMNNPHKIKVTYGDIRLQRTESGDFTSLYVRDNANDTHVLLTDDNVEELIAALTSALEDDNG
jgi:hypothetical protein